MKRIDELEKWMGNFSVDFPCFVGENEDFPCFEQRFLPIRFDQDFPAKSQINPRSKNSIAGRTTSTRKPFFGKISTARRI
jgi:hypothetical protein